MTPSDVATSVTADHTFLRRFKHHSINSAGHRICGGTAGIVLIARGHLPLRISRISSPLSDRRGVHGTCNRRFPPGYGQGATELTAARSMTPGADAVIHADNTLCGTGYIVNRARLFAASQHRVPYADAADNLLLNARPQTLSHFFILWATL